MFLILSLLYTSYGVFNPSNIDSGYISQGQSQYNYNRSVIGNSSLNENYEYDAEAGNDFIGMIFGVGSFLTFGGVGDTWVRMVLNTFTTICFIGIGFIIYLFVRDWIPFIG